MFVLYVVLNGFLQELDKKIVAQQNDTKKHIPERRERELGDDVSSYPPSTAPKWTIDKDWLKGDPIVEYCIVKFIYSHILFRSCRLQNLRIII